LEIFFEKFAESGPLLPVRPEKSLGTRSRISSKTVFGNVKKSQNRGGRSANESAFTYKTIKSFGDEVKNCSKLISKPILEKKV
jgi:hypothetical protein